MGEVGVHTLGAITPTSLASLISAVGGEDFEPKLMAMIRDVTGAERISAFGFDAVLEPFFLLASGLTSAHARFARAAGARYVTGFWRHDRALGVELAKPSRATSDVFRQKLDEIPADYRAFCYDSHDVIERASVVYRSGRLPVMLNFYRRVTSGPFGSAGLERIERNGELLGSIVAKHAELERDKAAGPGDRLTGRPDPRALLPVLSEKEADVCSRLAVGQSYKEIARKLNLMPSSVVTYRKRAYVKLGIASRMELAALLGRRACY